MRLVYIFLISALAGSCIVLIYLVGSLMGRVSVLERKVESVWKQIEKIGTDMDCMCDHVWYCVEHINYINADLKRKEEETK